MNSAPLRILFVVHHVLDPNAGVGGATLALVDAMRAQGHEVRTFGFEDAFPDGIPPGARFRFPWRVAEFLRREGHRFDVVDATSGDAWVWLSRRTGGPCIVTRAHGLEQVANDALLRRVAAGETHVSWRYRLYSGGFRLWEVARSIRAADGVIMLNTQDAAYVQRTWHVPAARVLVAVNAVPDAMRALPAPTRASSEQHPLRLTFVGSWIPRKGIALLTRMTDLLVERGLDFRFDLLGTGTSSDAVLAEFSPRARERVHVVPTYDRSQLAERLAGAHLLLHPSWAEGFSMALVEGMACGLAPVATDSGASREVLQQQTAGMMPEPATPEAFAEAILALDADRARLHALRSTAHARAVGVSWSDVATSTIAFYRTLTASR